MLTLPSHRIDIPDGAGYYPQIIWHLCRYKFVKGFIRQTDEILDGACGTGYGARMLSDYCRSVVGLDLCPEAVARANELYGGENRTFKIRDVLYADGKYDVIVCFETLEHLSREDGVRLMDVYKSCLKPNGILFISTPKKLPVEELSQNRIESHIFEYTFEDFNNLLHQFYDRPIMFSQTDEVISIGNLKACWTYIGVCWNGR
jgi:2-polyprenyl-3-methyl-5-hydroxy-6-metoxy-1,4-benzoquinol methylase